MKSNALRQNLSDFSEANLADDGKHGEAEVKFPPRNLNALRQDIPLITLRMYTEEEVAEILQVSSFSFKKRSLKARAFSGSALCVDC